ncbi:uridine kinase [Culicoidibacter larvae]|uniref:Uridine kinase n=1 Tax=Culicoidibacter larvae TaxID=2579976 RepID=A0A5R8QCP7_9FIRM|nr:uridine kinase [Culicoidibacter larvae]TLG74278.1 uridine kinase [Culicoidibacter larvae]
MNKPLIIGIAGGSASGKTTVAEKIYDSLRSKSSTIIIRHDDYYKDQSHMPMEERVLTNYDHPFSLDNGLLIEHLKLLLENKAINKPIYDFKEHTRSQDCEIIEPVEIIILEGILVLEDKGLRELMDIKLYVDTEHDIRFIRRLLRDMNERGRSLDSVVTQYETTVRPMHMQFVEPSKRFADLIIPDGGENMVAVDLLVTKINSTISE